MCGLINVIDPKLLHDKHYVRLYLTHAPPSDGAIPKRIETLAALPSMSGWHEDETGRPVCVVKEAKQFRTPEFKCDPKVWLFRTTWLLQNGAWVKLENRVRWKDLPNSRAEIRALATKAIFRFESEMVAAGAQVVKTVNLITEHIKKGILTVHDIVVKNGRITQLSCDDLRLLTNAALCPKWPSLRCLDESASRVGNYAGGHFGRFRWQNMRQLGCTDMTLIVPDIDNAIQDLMRPHLRNSNGNWVS